MKSVSQILKNEREKKKLTLEQVSEYTKIGINYLQSIEKGDYSSFPSTTTAKGFINNYAKFLNLDLNEVNALYRREQVIKDKTLSNKFTHKIKIRRVLLTPTFIIAVTTIAAAIGILSYLWIQYTNFNTPPKLLISSPYNNQITSSDNVTIKGSTDLGNKVAVDGETIPLPDALGKFTISISLNQGQNIITISATNNFGKTNTKKITVIYTPPIDNNSSINPLITPPMSITLSITSDSAWINMIIDNKTVLDGILPSGTKKTYTAKKNIDIRTARASDTILNVNNQNIPLEGTGVVEKIISLDSNNNLVITPQ